VTVPHYPVNDFGPVMKGLAIGGVGVVHVFLAQFAIGGGMLLWNFERRSQRGERDVRVFVDGFFPVLVLVSFVLAMLRRPSDRVLAHATAAGTTVLLSAVVVREAPRVALIELHAAGSGGAVTFAIALVLGTAAVAWVVHQIRS
jgi:hypothetical protein